MIHFIVETYTCSELLSTLSCRPSLLSPRFDWGLSDEGFFSSRALRRDFRIPFPTLTGCADEPYGHASAFTSSFFSRKTRRLFSSRLFYPCLVFFLPDRCETTYPGLYCTVRCGNARVQNLVFFSLLFSSVRVGTLFQRASFVLFSSPSCRADLPPQPPLPEAPPI